MQSIEEEKEGEDEDEEEEEERKSMDGECLTPPVCSPLVCLPPV